MKKPVHALSRRQFLARATAAGVAVSLPPLLVGCGDDGEPGTTGNPIPGKRESRHLHFDFSRSDIEQLKLHVIGSRSHHARITRHDRSSRVRHRQLNPALAGVPDEQLTHFAEDVDLPADALQLVWVTGKRGNGDDVLASMHVHRPRAAGQRSRAAAAARGRAVRQARVLGLGSGGGALPDLDTFVSPFEVAVALVFHTLETMNLDLEQGTDILTLIETLPCDPNDSTCAPFIATLAFKVAQMWPASVNGGWATLVPVTDDDGTVLKTSSGAVVYRYDVEESVAVAACTVAGEIKKAIFDDPQYAGANWHPTQGVTTNTVSSGGGAALFPRGTSTGISVVGQHPAGTTVHGVEFDHIEVANQTNRFVRITVRNQFLRVLSVFVQFTDADGNVVPASFSNAQDTTRAAFLRWVPSNLTIFGVPLIGDDVPSYDFGFPVPTNASAAKVYYGSLGVGGDAFSPEAVSGSVLTLVINLGLPTMSLALGLLIDKNAAVSIVQWLLTQEAIAILEAVLAEVTEHTDPTQNGVYYADLSSSSASKTLAQLGNQLLLSLMKSGLAAKLVQILGRVITQDESLELAGPVGMAFKILATAANLSAIFQSVAEVLASPAIFTNKVLLSQTTTVTIQHDPDDFQFPATARSYRVSLQYDNSSVTFCSEGAVTPPQSDPIVVSFTGVPSGGSVTVDIYFINDQGCIVGRSTDANGEVGPHGPVDGTETSITVTIKELLVPLNADTRYVHTLKLEYQNGQHIWAQTGAPQATRASLCQGQEGQLCALTDLTISQRTGMAGYAYEAGGQGINLCSDSVASILHVFRNIFLGQRPDSGLKQLPCGFDQPAGIVYDRLGPADGSGANFFLQPTPNGVFVKPVTLDATSQFDPGAASVWGAFIQPPDSLAHVPSGFLAAVNRSNHKLEILELPETAGIASDLRSFPFAVQKMGLGTRVGLLASPVAVAVFGTTVLILEDGNKRVQAVDVSGNPVAQFAGASTFALLSQSDQVFLDIAVEGLGFMYVLSYVSSGLTPASYILDVYTPDGAHLLRQTGVSAGRLEVDTFRNLYTLNYETISGAPHIEPSLSQWEPSTPGTC